jgi:hypothetical protein
MTVKELIEKLQGYREDMTVKIDTWDTESNQEIISDIEEIEVDTKTDTLILIGEPEC